MLLIVSFDPSSKMGRAAVQPVEMRRIDGVLHRLEPIAVDQRIDHDPAPSVLPGQNIPTRQQRLWLGSKIGEQQPAEFLPPGMPFV